MSVEEGSGAKVRREEKGTEGTRCRSEKRKEEKKRHEKSSFVLERERETKMWARAGSTERNKTKKKSSNNVRSDQC